MSTARPAGDAALLIEAGAGPAAGSPAGLAAAIVAAALPGVTDVVPGADTVLVVTEPGSWDLGELARRIRELPPAPPGAAPGGTTVEIPVCYDGPDLAEVAELTGLPVREVIERHQAARYEVGWLGFSPGFGYLTGLDPVLAAVPRLATPRQRVPTGSVAIAGGLAAIYPSASPGGWRLLGHTRARMWDVSRQPPALLAPGTRVRFRAVSAGGAAAGGARAGSGVSGATGAGSAERRAEDAGPGGADADEARAGTVEVLRPGPLLTVQDLGRPGYGHLGVPPGGAADAASLRRANRLAGNPDGAAGLESTLGGVRLRFREAAVVAVGGAAAVVTVIAPGGTAQDAQEAPRDRAVRMAAGSELRLGTPASGLRCYVAVRGGIDVPAELGSRSADLASGLGPRQLRAGDRLRVGSGAAGAAEAGPVAGGPGGAGGPVVLRVVPGPRADWFAAGALEALAGGRWQVTPASNRVGLRLSGTALAWARDGELPSEGMVSGALEVPPDGQPILLLADHPTTGGYPVIAVVHSADVGRAAQLRPGENVRFTLAP